MTKPTLVAAVLVLAAGVGFLSAGLNTPAVAQAKPAEAAAVVWEYKMHYETTGYGPDRIEKELNRLGAEGWEVVGTDRSTGIGSQFRVILKRKK